MRAETRHDESSAGTASVGRAPAVSAAAAVAAVVAVGGVAGVASAGEQAATAPAAGGTLTVVVGADPGSLDPHISVFATTNCVNSFAYETLVYLGQDGEITPGLAESWEETPDERHLHAEGRRHLRRRHTVDGHDGRRQLLVRRRSGQPVAAARPVRPAGHHRRGRRRGPHRDADERGARPVLPAEHRCRPVHRVRRRPGRSQHPRLRHRRHRSVRPRRGRRQRPLHVQRPGRLRVGARRRHQRAARVPRPRWSCGSSRTSRRRPTCCCPARSTSPAIAGADRQRVENEGYFVIENRAIVGEFFFNQMEGLPTADVAVRQALMGALDLQRADERADERQRCAGHRARRDAPKACPGDTVGAIPHGRRRPRSGRAAARRGRLGDGLGRRPREGRRAAVDPRLLRHSSRELGRCRWSWPWRSGRSSASTCSCKASTHAQFNTIAFETRAWDVFLAALNLDVPSLAVPFVSGPQPPDGVNFSAVANPEYDALVAEAARSPVRRRAPCGTPPRRRSTPR